MELRSSIYRGNTVSRTLYINHPAEVAKRLQNRPEFYQAAAWLHDVVEDSDMTYSRLKKYGIPYPVVIAVKLLTKKGKISYEKYIQNIKRNSIAREVKIADIMANLSDSPTEKQVAKYNLALAELL